MPSHKRATRLNHPNGKALNTMPRPALSPHCPPSGVFIQEPHYPPNSVFPTHDPRSSDVIEGPGFAFRWWTHVSAVPPPRPLIAQPRHPMFKSPIRTNVIRKMCRAANYPARLGFILDYVDRIINVGLDQGIVLDKLPPQGVIDVVTDPWLIAQLDNDVASGRSSPPVSMAEASRQKYFFNKLFKRVELHKTKPRAVLDVRRPNKSANETARLATFTMNPASAVADNMVEMGSGFASTWDVQGAYRDIPVRPDMTHMFAVAVRRQRLDGTHVTLAQFDLAASFGAQRSSHAYGCLQEPSSFLEWFAGLHAVKQSGIMDSPSRVNTTWVRGNHYADDSLAMARIRRVLAIFTLAAIAVSAAIGVTIADDKTNMAMRSLVYLGFGLNTYAVTLFITADRAARLAHKLDAFRLNASVRHQPLYAVAGVASYFHSALPAMSRQAFAPLLSTAARAYHAKRNATITLAIHDAARLLEKIIYMIQLSPISLLPTPTRVTLRLETDASGSWGLGALLFLPNNDVLAFAMQLPPDLLLSDKNATRKRVSMPLVETSTMLVAAALFAAKYWSHALLDVNADSYALLSNLTRGAARDSLGPSAILLLPVCEAFIELHTVVRPAHFDTHANVRADHLSHGRIPQAFAALPPKYRPILIDIPQTFVDTAVAQIRAAVTAAAGTPVLSSPMLALPTLPQPPTVTLAQSARS